MSYPKAERVEVDVKEFRYMGCCFVHGRLRAIQLAVGLTKAMGERCVVRHKSRSGHWMVFREGNMIANEFEDLTGRKCMSGHRLKKSECNSRAWRDRFHAMDLRDRRNK